MASSYAACRVHPVRRAALIALAVGLPVPAMAQDVLVLTNGDRVSGQLTAIAGGRWRFKHAGGMLDIPGTAVTSYASGSRIGVRLSDGSIAAGRVSVVDGTMRFAPTDGAARTITPVDLAAIGNPDDLPALRPIAIGFLSPLGRFWGASVGAGFANKSGNSRSRGFNGDFRIERKTAKDRLAFQLGAATEWSGDPADLTSDLRKVGEKYYGSARLDVFVAKALFLFGGTLQESDKFQGIDLRSNYAGGLGYQVLATDPTDLRFDLSAGLRVENFTPTAGDTTISTPIASAGSQLRQKLGPMTFDWSLRWTPAVEDVQDYRFLSDAGLSTTLFRGLGFRIGSRNEYNNNPPIGIEKHDWLTTFRLTYAIGS